MFCRHCGKGIPEDSRFCPNCGTKIDSVETVKPPKIREKQIRKANECCVCGSKDIGSFGANFSRDGDAALCGLHYRLYQELSKKAAGMAAARTGERFSPADYPRCGVNEAGVILTAIGIAQDSKRGKEPAASYLVENAVFGERGTLGCAKLTSTKFSSSNVDRIAPEDTFDKPQVVQVTDPHAMRCPKCGCTSLSGNKKGYGAVKGVGGALAGAALAGPVGLALGAGAGNVGRKKVVVTCMRCGHKWKA